MKHCFLKTTLVSLGLLIGGIRVMGQSSADTTIRSYISAANDLSDKLAQIVDADTAQRNAPLLVLAINRLNPLTAQVKALFGGQSNLAALQSLAEQLTAAQTRLQKEESRLLTGNCGMEGTVKSTNEGMSIKVVFVNKTRETVNIFWLNYAGLRIAQGTIQPNGRLSVDTSATHPFVAANSDGLCIGLFQPPDLGEVKVNGELTATVSGLLAPSVDLYLQKITK